MEQPTSPEAEVDVENPQKRRRTRNEFTILRDPGVLRTRSEPRDHLHLAVWKDFYRRASIQETNTSEVLEPSANREGKRRDCKKVYEKLKRIDIIFGGTCRLKKHKSETPANSNVE